MSIAVWIRSQQIDAVLVVPIGVKRKAKRLRRIFEKEKPFIDEGLELTLSQNARD
ncbi:undecaprenyl-diphosphatase [Vibrio vulnificus]|nr:undecaprenyl-diphosphatase [Vibrio vulnificus]